MTKEAEIEINQTCRDIGKKHGIGACTFKAPGISGGELAIYADTIEECVAYAMTISHIFTKEQKK